MVLLLPLAVTVGLSLMPGGYYAIYPFKLFTTWVHECGHALAALTAGGGEVSITLAPDTSGLPVLGLRPRSAPTVSCMRPAMTHTCWCTAAGRGPVVGLAALAVTAVARRGLGLAVIAVVGGGPTRLAVAAGGATVVGLAVVGLAVVGPTIGRRSVVALFRIALFRVGRAVLVGTRGRRTAVIAVVALRLTLGSAVTLRGAVAAAGRRAVRRRRWRSSSAGGRRRRA